MAQHELNPMREFDALLQEELSVLPSPEVLPRVREAVDAEPARRRWSLFAGRWSLFAGRSPLVAPFAAVAATVVVATGLWILAAADVTSPPAPAAPPINVASVSPHPNVSDAEGRTPTFALRATAGKPSTEHRTANSEQRTPNPETRTANREPRTANREQRPAEVIVDQRQRTAFIAMMRLVNQGQLTEDSFKNTTPAPVEIGVEPVALSPIVVGGVLPPESDRK